MTVNKFFVTKLWQKINKFVKDRTILWAVTLVATLGLGKVGRRHVCKKRKGSLRQSLVPLPRCSAHYSDNEQGKKRHQKRVSVAICSVAILVLHSGKD